MRIGILGKVLRHTWAIDERYALASGGIIAGLLAGNEIDDEDKAVENENAKPYAISFDASGKGRRVSGYDEAERGSIAVIPVRGPLMKDDEDNCGELNAGMATLATRVREADEHPNIASTILYIDSPGGTVDGTQAFADAIRGTSKPVVAFVDGLMASAALWIGTSANHIVAENSTTEIGSIGVMMSFADMQPMWEQRGVKFHRIVSDLSKDKNKEFYDALDGNYDTMKEQSLNPLAQVFIDAVKANRGDKITSDEIFTGKVYFAPDALSLGLIDEIGSFDVAVERARSLSQSNNLSNSKPRKNMKALTALCALLAVSALEATEDGVFLNEEQLDAIEARLADMERLQLDAQQANERANTAANDLSTANGRITSLEADLEEARRKPGAETSKVVAHSDSNAATQENKPVVQDGDDIMTAIDKVGEKYL